MIKEAEDYFDNTISADFFGLMLGDKLGAGAGREVYAMDSVFGTDYVVKFECTGRSFQNTHEWRLWNDFKSVRSVARWLAPCVWISSAGTVLLQRRTTPILGELPLKAPAWKTVESDNFSYFRKFLT